jgi:protein-S-isoprenylcysteine O-methyltransferase Ste14
MAEHLEDSGTLLFRRRGSLPTMLILPVVLLSLADYRHPGSAAVDLLWELVCFVIAACGLAIRVVVSGTVPEGTSGRNTERQRADELNTTGVYALVRHPLYLGNFLVGLGIALQPRVWYVPVIFVLGFALYYERVIMAEERFLEQRFGDTFLTWAAAVPMFLPKVNGSLQQTLRSLRSKLPFSARAALRREYYGICMVITVFFLLDLLEDLVQFRRLMFDRVWAPLFLVAAASFFALRALKHRTDFLERP